MISQSSQDGDVRKPQHVEINAIVLYITTFFQSTGASLIWPITTLYMHNVLHQSMTVAGIVVMGLSVTMMIGNWLGGKLFDHWNPFKALVISVGLALLTLLSLTFWNSWPVFAIFMLISGFADGLIYTLLNSYATTIQTIDTRKVFNLQYLFMNVGVVAGTAVVGFLFDYGVELVFGGAAVMYGVFFVLVLKFFNVKGLAKQSARAAEKAAKSTFKTPVVIYAILGLAFSFYMSYILWETVIATHMTDLGMTAKDYSFLWTLNGVIIIFGQGLLDRFIERLPVRWTVLGGSTLFALSFLILIQATTYPMFVFSFVILTIGEILSSPQIPAWIDDLSDPNAKGHAQGLLTMFVSLGRAIGPLYGGLLIDSGSYKLLFTSVFAIMFFFVLLTGLLSKRHVRN
ncbi:MFS transporter [Weissella bombi]|uniref:Predicted arabinose efflux permease, MFS family n=1 Tax=Weissella bombi TaxID=1505725 RepID=A0A1C4BBZ5_9LACO|nr:MFS transporter [Weissella bombi]SCC04369.1 Predicted arabinose efflux permease, MFS family [Weissella bombi]